MKNLCIYSLVFIVSLFSITACNQTPKPYKKELTKYQKQILARHKAVNLCINQMIGYDNQHPIFWYVDNEWSRANMIQVSLEICKQLAKHMTPPPPSGLGESPRESSERTSPLTLP